MRKRCEHIEFINQFKPKGNVSLCVSSKLSTFFFNSHKKPVTSDVWERTASCETTVHLALPNYLGKKFMISLMSNNSINKPKASKQCIKLTP